MIFVIVFAVLLSIALILIIRGETPTLPFKPSMGAKISRLGERPTDSQDPRENLPPISDEIIEKFRTLSLDTLEDFCRSLIRHTQLTFHSIEQFSEQEFYILTSIDKPIIRGNIIFCGYLVQNNPVVNSDTIIGFSDMVKAERAMKGVFVTNGLFSEEVMKLNEGASIELVDVAQLAKMMQEIAPELFPTG